MTPLISRSYVKWGGIDWPKGTSEAAAMLAIARYYHIHGWLHRNMGAKVAHGGELGMIPPNEAMFRAVKLLIPETEYKMSPWGEIIITGFTGDEKQRREELVVQAPASATKSQTMGLLLPLHWYTSPLDTTCRLISTDIKGLKQRSWNSVTQYYTILKKQGAGGVFSRQTLAILNADDEDERFSAASQKAGIFAFALASGTLEDGISRCIGTHWPHGSVVLLADEAQSINPHFYGGLSNLWIGTEDVRMISLGNPMTLTDALANRAEPEAGWGAVSIEDDSWVSKRGALVIHLNGEKSPALAEPEKYPFLIKQVDIDRTLKENFGRKESAGYRSMVQGWWSDGDEDGVLITRSLLIAKKALDPAVFIQLPRNIFAGLDPAGGFGDAIVLRIAYEGLLDNGRRGLQFIEPIKFKIKRGGDALPVQYQIAKQVADARKEHPFPLHHLAVDESGLQLFSDVIEMEAQQEGVMRVSFAAPPDDAPVSALDDTPKKKKYANMVTQLWMDTAALIEFSQLRELGDEAAHEFTIRRTIPNKRPLRLESKLDLKKRLKRSPDTADATALCVYAAITAGGLLPGATLNSRGFSGFRRQAKKTAQTIDSMLPSFETGSDMNF